MAFSCFLPPASGAQAQTYGQRAALSLCRAAALCGRGRAQHLCDPAAGARARITPTSLASIAAAIARYDAPAPQRAAAIARHSAADRGLIEELRKRSEAKADRRASRPNRRQNRPSPPRKKWCAKSRSCARPCAWSTIRRASSSAAMSSTMRRCRHGAARKSRPSRIRSTTAEARRNGRRRQGCAARHPRRSRSHHSRAGPHEHPPVPQGRRAGGARR